MPTVDQLAPATAASDTDVLLTDQAGITRKITRAQLIAGLQPELAIPQGCVVGRGSSGVGAVEVIQVGANLSLNSGTISAAASAFQVSSLAAGVVPRSSDAVPVGQNGTNVAVPYSQFLSGISNVPGLDISGTTITPTGGAAPQKLADWAAGVVLDSGGTLTGALTAPALAVGTIISCAGRVDVNGPVACGSLIAQFGLAVEGGWATMPSYVVANLPKAPPGSLAYAANGRKPGELGGIGTGVLVWATAAGQWLSIISGTTVQA